MDIEFDADKDIANRTKHGIPLATGRLVLENCVGDMSDVRQAYGEDRRIAFGLVAGRLFVCVYTMRSETCRVISVRKANRREQRKWLP